MLSRFIAESIQNQKNMPEKPGVKGLSNNVVGIKNYRLPHKSNPPTRNTIYSVSYLLTYNIFQYIMIIILTRECRILYQV